jgi:hypothetical protein
MLLSVSSSTAQTPNNRNDAKPSWVDRFFGLKHDHRGGWLFAASKEDAKDGIYFALSKDGYHWIARQRWQAHREAVTTWLTHARSVRVACAGRQLSYGLDLVHGYARRHRYSTSSNLVFWTEQRQLPVIAAIPAARNAWCLPCTMSRTRRTGSSAGPALFLLPARPAALRTIASTDASFISILFS